MQEKKTMSCRHTKWVRSSRASSPACKSCCMPLRSHAKLRASPPGRLRHHSAYVYSEPHLWHPARGSSTAVPLSPLLPMPGSRRPVTGGVAHPASAYEEDGDTVHKATITAAPLLTMVTHAPEENTARTCRCFSARKQRVEHEVVPGLGLLPSFCRNACMDLL